MQRLAALAKLTVAELYEVHLSKFLDEVQEAPLWEEDIQRQLLDSLVKCSSTRVVAQNLARILPILATQTDAHGANPTARVDLLALAHHLLSLDSDEVRAAWKTGEVEEESVMIGVACDDLEVPQTHALELMRAVLCPNAVWKSGQANQRIRKGALVCMTSVLEGKLLGGVELRAVFTEILPTLKSVLDDTWSPDNRLLGTLVVGGILRGLVAGEIHAEMEGEILREIYPELLKRLDDSNDAIRQAVCGVLQTFFEILQSVPKWGESVYVYIIKHLFVHLDDPSEDMQKAMSEVLRVAVHVHPASFLAEARTAAAKSCHPRACEELARLAETLQSVDAM